MKREPAYREGMADGMRAAVAIIRELEATMAERLEREQASIRTRNERRTRTKAYGVAAKRITTRLKVMERPKAAAADIEARIQRLGL